MNTTWSRAHTWGLLAITVGICLGGYVAASRSYQLAGWLFTLLLFVLFLVITGHGINGLWYGWLIDTRNKMSLSRLQISLWTAVVLSGFFCAALANIAGKKMTYPLDIAIPTELWVAMGIATTSLVGSPLILANKKRRTPNADEWEKTRKTLNTQGVDEKTIIDPIMEGKSIIVEYRSPSDARLANMFCGDETGNEAILDLGKIQMFCFTIILVLAYCFAIGKIFSVNPKCIASLPPLSDGEIALLAISHAGYLANKIAPHSQTQ